MELVHQELEVARVCSFSSSWEGQITVSQLQAPSLPTLTFASSHLPSSHHLPLPPISASYPHASPIPTPTTQATSSQTLAQGQQLV